MILPDACLSLPRSFLLPARHLRSSFWLLELDDDDLLGQIGEVEVRAKMLMLRRSWTARRTRGRVTSGERERRGRRRGSDGGRNLGASQSCTRDCCVRGESVPSSLPSGIFHHRCVVDLCPGGATCSIEKTPHAVTKGQVYRPEWMIQIAHFQDPTTDKRSRWEGLQQAGHQPGLNIVVICYGSYKPTDRFILI